MCPTEVGKGPRDLDPSPSNPKCVLRSKKLFYSLFVLIHSTRFDLIHFTRFVLIQPFRSHPPVLFSSSYLTNPPVSFLSVLFSSYLTNPPVLFSSSSSYLTNPPILISFVLILLNQSTFSFSSISFSYRILFPLNLLICQSTIKSYA